MTKKISVLMGIYNCAATLEQAVQAIRNQTYPFWELILCDDGSTDRTYEIAERLAEEDGRIILLRNEKNLGLNETLNRCLKAASGVYIARMDGDDTCVPERFEQQVALLEREPQYAITSSPMILFDEHGQWGRTKLPEYPTPEQVVAGSAICHAPVMLRREAIEAVGGYTVDPKVLRVEDVDLWIKLYTAGYRCHNITTPLYWMRNDQNAMNRRKYIYRVNSVRVRLKGCRAMKLGIKSYLKSIKPMVIGLIPGRVRWMIRVWRQRKIEDASKLNLRRR